MTRATALLFLSGLLATAACAAPTEEPGTAPEVDTDEAAATSMKYYDCKGGDAESSLSRLEVGLSSTRIAVTDLSKDAVVPDVGERDRSYKPTAFYAGAIRFAGFEKILDDLKSTDIGNLEFIVSTELQAKAAGGRMWMRTSGAEGGATTRYYCREKTAKVTLSTATKARLACALEHVICQNDNPPGETCLTDLFINQTAAQSATLRLTYLDHFGVFAKERKVTVGASTDLSRTTRQLSGAWGDHDLELRYRGGITYTGQFKLPDGRSEAVKCNDLAMLD